MSQSWRYHVPPGVAYRKGATPAAVIAAARAKFRGIDLDTRKTLDGIEVVAHWDDISKEGWTAPGIPAHARITELTWAQVKTLRTPDGDRIYTLSELLAVAAQVGIVGCIEAKRSDPRWKLVATWTRIGRIADKHGATIQATAVKSLWGKRDAAAVQRAAAKAGIPNWHRPTRRPKPVTPEVTVSRLPNNLPDLLRREGLTVIEIGGWQDRGRPGSFAPVGTLWHHTGSYDALADPKDDLDYANWLAKIGRDDLDAPLCQLSISREGVVYVCAAGRANHAGTAKPHGSVAGGNGNTLYVGIECMNSGSQGWSVAQRRAMELTAVVLHRDVLKTSTRALAGHKETSVTGKWDPGGFDMDQFRSRVAALINEPAKKPEPEDDMTPDQERQLAETLSWAKSARAQALAAHTNSLKILGMVEQMASAEHVQIDMDAIAKAVRKGLADGVADELADRLKE